MAISESHQQIVNRFRTLFPQSIAGIMIWYFKEIPVMVDNNGIPLSRERIMAIRDACRMALSLNSDHRISAATVAMKDAMEREEASWRASHPSSRKMRDPRFVYVLKNTISGAFKIGISNSPARRAAKIQDNLEVICSTKVAEARKIEMELHRRFDHRRIGGEWFSLSPEDVVEIVRILSTKSHQEISSR